MKKTLSEIPNGGSFRFGKVKFTVRSLSRTNDDLIACEIGKTNEFAYLSPACLVFEI